MIPFQQQQQQMLPQQQQQQMLHNSGAMYSDYEEKERLRFQIELEFVQCLANPNYLNFLQIIVPGRIPSLLTAFMSKIPQ